jgi:hypothetical protein
MMMMMMMMIIIIIIIIISLRTMDIRHFFAKKRARCFGTRTQHK